VAVVRLEGGIDTTVITIDTGRLRGVTDLTSEVRAYLRGRGDGLLNVFVPHATAGLAIVETGAGSDHDLLDRLEHLLPHDDSRYRHRHGTPGHGADHVLPAFLAPTLTVPVLEGAPALGVWQSIVLVDTNADNPERQVRLSFLPA
jgi:secondary thiamine-phosphate synthase enzyme